MKLGDKLKNTLDELERAKIEGIEAQHNADMAKIRREREEIQKFLNGTRDSIVDQINSEKVPLVKVKNYGRQDWLRKATQGKAEHQDMWKDFRQFWANEGLEPVITEAHDGMGMESWVNLTVKVLPPRPRNLSLKEQEGLGVGDYRG